MKLINNLAVGLSVLSLSMFTVSCEDTKSYSELLTEEEHAVNWYLAQNDVCLEIPEDGNFEVGADAPFYKMDPDGFVYMRVIDKGEEDNKPKKGDTIYFRFMRCDIKSWQSSGYPTWAGNSEDLGSYAATKFVFGNNILTSTTQFGEGIQVPMEYLGYNSRVELIVKSPDGFTDDVSYCIPYLYKYISYFKAEY